MARSPSVVAVALLVAVPVAPIASQPPPMVFDLSADFSDVANASGAWSLNAGTSPIPLHQSDWVVGGFSVPQPAWANAPTGSGHIPAWFKQVGVWTLDSKPGDVVMHATDYANGLGTDFANVTWVSPCAGNVAVSGGVWMLRPFGRSLTWTVSLDGSPKGTGVLDDNGPWRANPAPIVFSAAVAAGSVVKLQFVKNSVYGDLAGVDLRIALTADCAHFQTFGRSCGPAVGAGAPPVLGTTLPVQVAGGTPSSPGVLLLGAVRQFLDLAPRMPTCFLYTQPIVSVPMTTDPSGAGGVGVPLPPQSSLLGAVLYTQFGVVAPAANRLGVEASDAGWARLGR